MFFLAVSAIFGALKISPGNCERVSLSICYISAKFFNAWISLTGALLILQSRSEVLLLGGWERGVCPTIESSAIFILML